MEGHRFSVSLHFFATMPLLPYNWAPTTRIFSQFGHPHFSHKPTM